MADFPQLTKTLRTNENMRSIRPWITATALILGMSHSALTGAEEYGINLKSADIREFITMVSSMTGKSFVVDERLKGKVTVISNTKLGPDEIYELFLSVLRVQGYAAVPAGEVIKIVQQVLAKQSGNPNDFNTYVSEEIITHVIPVRNTSAAELVKTLRPLVPQYSHIAGLTEPNALIISDHASNIQRLQDMVEKIDVADSSGIEIVNLTEAWVDDMVALLEQLAPEQIGKGANGPNRVRVVASERTNSLVLKGQPPTLIKMKELIRQLDVPANRSGTVQVVRLAHSDAKDMAELLKNLVADGDKEKQGTKDVAVSIQADEGLNALVIRANPATQSELLDLISRLDVRRLQVLIEGVIVEVTTDFDRTFSTELGIGDASSGSTPIGLTRPIGTIANLLQSLATGTASIPPLNDQPTIGAGRQSATGVSFAAIVRALSSNSNTNLLSTPSITTMDNEEAKIVVGQQVPFRTGSTVTGSQGASNPFTTIQRQDVGLTLQVTPHIHDGSVIRLEISQEVSEVSQNAVGSSTSADLITNRSEIVTTILANDGEIVVLGGLSRDKEADSVSGVPGLQNIPILGRLFKDTSTKKEKSSLLVFLRPTVLRNNEEMVSEVERKYRGVWEVEIEGRDANAVVSDLFDGNRP